MMIQVPSSLLLSPVLTPSAKLVWLLSGAGGSPYRLGQVTGLARNTVMRALDELAAFGGSWDGPAVRVPGALLSDGRLSARARVLYGCLLLLPGFGFNCVRFTYGDLAAVAQVDLKTARKAVAELVEAEWIRVEQVHRRDQLFCALAFPGLEQELTALAVAEGRLIEAEFYGEGLMREYLSLLVDSTEFEDNATPGWLVSPRTRAELQLDRFYPPQVGFEFNGAQHYRKTARFSAEQSAVQQERDHIKMGLCVARGVTLVVVKPADLTVAGMRQKVGSLLPLRDLAGYGLLMDYLEDESELYRRSLAHI